MTINRRKISFLALGAVLWGLAMGITLPAHAVYVSQTGLGEVLVFPYYTVRGGTDTYLSVVNTQNRAKAVKVRFTEGKNSREVLDFNLYLSAYDMWTGAVVATADGAKLITRDNSCTSPAIPAGGAPFVNYAYTLSAGGVATVVEGIVDTGGDGEATDLDRTREGYFEIIEMGNLSTTGPGSVTYAAAATHLTTGVPLNCALLQGSTVNMGSTGLANNQVTVTTGGLGGTATLINVANGTDFGYDPTVLESFNNLDNLWYAPGDIRPDMRNALPASIIFNGGAAVTSTYTGLVNQDAVSAVLMHESVINEYVLDAATLSGTDWVITMPTKRYYVPVDNGVGTAQTIFDPFTSAFFTDGACESVSLQYWDREEQQPSTPPSGVPFSPPQPGAPAPGTFLCWETSIITFNNSDVLQSDLSVNVDVGTYENGWMNVTFNGGQSMVGLTGPIYYGLPAIGFMVQDFVNGNVGGVLSNYGGNFSHKFTVSTSP